MNNILQLLDNIIVGIMAICSGVWDWSDRQIRAFIYAELLIIGASLSLLIVGFAFKLALAVQLAAVIAALAFLVGGMAADQAVRILTILAAKLPFINVEIKTSPDELKKFLPSLVSLSLTLAFIALVSAIRGPGYYTAAELTKWTAITFFVSVFATYLQTKTKLFGWVLFSMALYLVICDFFFPIHAKSILDYVDGAIIKRATLLTRDSLQDELAIVPPDTPLYGYGYGKFQFAKKSPSCDTTVKLIGRRDDPASKDPLYEVILPSAPGIYIGGESIFVPARLVKLLTPVIIPIAHVPSPPPAVTPLYGGPTWKKLVVRGDKGRIVVVDRLKKGQNMVVEGSNFPFASQVDNGSTPCWRTFTPTDFGKTRNTDWAGVMKIKFLENNTEVHLSIQNKDDQG